MGNIIFPELEKCVNLIKQIENYKTETRAGRQLRIKQARIVFFSGDVLEVKEYYIGSRIEKYSYHLMNSDNELLVRWDNAHPVDLNTSPHHKHVLTDLPHLESEQPSLQEVLEVIRTKEYEKWF
ncbi:MAG: toxin-antitoxin system TumE family protein [Thermincolia bacterium]